MDVALEAATAELVESAFTAIARSRVAIIEQYLVCLYWKLYNNIGIVSAIFHNT